MAAFILQLVVQFTQGMKCSIKLVQFYSGPPIWGSLISLFRLCKFSLGKTLELFVISRDDLSDPGDMITTFHITFSLHTFPTASARQE